MREALCAIDTMKKRGIEPDNYTVSIMLKPLKRHGGRFEATRVLAMADSLGMEVFQDEVLVNSLIKVCVRLRETGRLRDLIAKYDETKRKPSQHL